MRLLAALLVSFLVLLAGCASRQPAPSCELATVPDEAVLGVREGVETATYPPQIPNDRVACQRVWYGDHGRLQAMKILATYYFDKGHVQRLVGQVPGGQAYDCRYREGALDAADSRNAQLCPAAARVEQLPLNQR
jgi:hypothetical protein